MQIRSKFPLLNTKINNKLIVYFDNSATTQKPVEVIEALKNFYLNKNSNVHRGINPLADIATREYEQGRTCIQKFINAKSKKEIIFTSGSTDSLNLVASIIGKGILKKGDIVVLSETEHHANIVPWLILKDAIGIKIKYLAINKDFKLDTIQAKKILSIKKVKVFSIQHSSNVTGSVYNLASLIKECKKNNIISIIDAASSISHVKINVQKMDCDFLVFSGHKIFGPTGTGVLYGKKNLLKKLPVWRGGGDMIREVKYQSFKESVLPYKYEAGTPNIAGVIGLCAAIQFVNNFGFSKIKSTEEKLTKYFLGALAKLDFVSLIGSRSIKDRAPIFSLVLKGVHPHDAADLLGESGIITRAGHHCTQPLHDKLKINATLRASLSFYNTTKEIDIFIKELKKINKIFK